MNFTARSWVFRRALKKISPLLIALLSLLAWYGIQTYGTDCPETVAAKITSYLNDADLRFEEIVQGDALDEQAIFAYGNRDANLEPILLLYRNDSIHPHI